MKMFRFIIKYFDEFNNNVVTIWKGIVSANSFASAVDKIIKYIGEENFISIEKLYELEDILEDKEIGEEVFKDE
jgi:hypothetical protein